MILHNLIDLDDTPNISIDTDSLITPCTPKVLVKSSHGCPRLQVNPLFDWLYDARYVMGPIAGLIGIYFMVFSLYCYKYTCYFIGVCTTPVLLLAFIYGVCVSDDSEDTWVVSVLAPIFLLVGLAVGLLFLRYKVLASIFSCFFAAWVVHSLLFIFFTHRFNNYDAAQIIFYIMLAAELSVGVLFGFLWFPINFVISTSLVGSYLFFRCISAFSDGFTNEFAINKERDQGRYDDIAWQNYLYIIFTFIVGTAMAFLQLRMSRIEDYKKGDEQQNQGFEKLNEGES